MSINGLGIPLWESGYLISWVSGSQAERLVADYFQIIPRCIYEMHALSAVIWIWNGEEGGDKAFASQCSHLPQGTQASRHRRAAGLCGHRHGAVAIRT